jgi:hypothetical protein
MPIAACDTNLQAINQFLDFFLVESFSKVQAIASPKNLALVDINILISFQHLNEDRDGKATPESGLSKIEVCNFCLGGSLFHDCESIFATYPVHFHTVRDPSANLSAKVKTRRTRRERQKMLAVWLTFPALCNSTAIALEFDNSCCDWIFREALRWPCWRGCW